MGRAWLVTQALPCQIRPERATRRFATPSHSQRRFDGNRALLVRSFHDGRGVAGCRPSQRRDLRSDQGVPQLKGERGFDNRIASHQAVSALVWSSAALLLVDSSPFSNLQMQQVARVHRADGLMASGAQDLVQQDRQGAAAHIIVVRSFRTVCAVCPQACVCICTLLALQGRTHIRCKDGRTDLESHHMADPLCQAQVCEAQGKWLVSSKDSSSPNLVMPMCMRSHRDVNAQVLQLRARSCLWLGHDVERDLPEMCSLAPTRGAHLPMGSLSKEWLVTSRGTCKSVQTMWQEKSL